VTSAAQKWRQRWEQLVAVLPSSLVDEVPWARSESDTALRRRRRIVAGVSLAGAGLLGTSLSTKPGSPQFYGLTLGVAATWMAGGLGSGPLHLGWIRHRDHTLRRPVLTPVLSGVGAFAVFYASALAARNLPILNAAISRILRYAHHGSEPLVLLTTLANGAAEEIFFRGALYAAIGGRHPVALSTAVYSLATTATRNPALVLASAAMGTLFGLQRRATGGIQAPILTHLTWSALMVHFLPPLFRDHPPTCSARSARATTSVLVSDPRDGGDGQTQDEQRTGDPQVHERQRGEPQRPHRHRPRRVLRPGPAQPRPHRDQPVEPAECEQRRPR
jgi:membrane protease YdiL (CAAX protease family)